MKLLISKKLINTISNLRNSLLGRKRPTSGSESMDEYYALARDNKTWSNVPDKDDFNWSIYNLHYRGELELGSKKYTLTLGEGDYRFSDGKLVRANKNILPMHSSHQLPYETILQLRPESVFELGVGNGMNLNNLHVLSPGIKLSGIGRSKEQLEFLRESYPSLVADIKQYDATIPFGNLFPKVDIAYSQAVIMHIKTNNTHLIALANLFNIAKKQVVLMENWTNHEFAKDIWYLFNKKLISWDRLYMYYRVSKEDPNTRIMICSQHPLDYPPLTDYKELARGLETTSFSRRIKNWLKAA